MNGLSLNILLIVLALTSVVQSQPGTYDHIQMVMTWPPSFCPSLQPPSACLAQPNHFVLHGLWPAFSNGFTCNDCKNWSIRDFRAAIWQNSAGLLLHWPGIRTDFNGSRMWYHQYKKHGSCAKANVSTGDYFRRAVHLATLIPYQGTFNLIAGTAYAQMVDLINTIGRSNIYLTCLQFNATHMKLNEIVFCIYGDMLNPSPFPCPVNPKRSKTCNSSNPIIFPA